MCSYLDTKKDYFYLVLCIHDRLIDYLVHKCGTLNKASIIFKRSPTYFYRPAFCCRMRTLIDICRAFNINLYWALTGKGNIEGFEEIEVNIQAIIESYKEQIKLHNITSDRTLSGYISMLKCKGSKNITVLMFLYLQDKLKLNFLDMVKNSFYMKVA